MLGAARRDLILGRLRDEGAVNTQALAAEMGLSEDTLRRDLRDLAAAGLCQRVYGGALPASPANADLATRRTIEQDSKARVAAAAVALVEPGSTVILDGGTTSLAVVRALPGDLACTIVTHSPAVAAALLDHASIEVFLLGGKIFRHSGVACGAVAAEAARTITADRFLMGVTGVHPSSGLTTGDAEEAAMKRTLHERAVETYVLASREKIGAASAFRVMGVTEVAGIVADAPDGSDRAGELLAGGARLVPVQR